MFVGAPAYAAACPTGVTGSCTSTQTLTETVAAGTLTVVAPAGFGLTSQAPGTTSAAQALGALSFTDTLNDATQWTVSASSTSFSNAAHTIAEVPWADIAFAPYSGALTPSGGAVGTPVTGSGGSLPPGTDTTPGTTIDPTGVSLVNNTAATVEGTWTTAAGVTGNTITITVPATTPSAVSYSAIVQYTITG